MKPDRLVRHYFQNKVDNQNKPDYPYKKEFVPFKVRLFNACVYLTVALIITFSFVMYKPNSLARQLNRWYLYQNGRAELTEFAKHFLDTFYE